jgi:hypothetical protein
MNNIKYNFDYLTFYVINWSFNDNKPKYINIMPFLDSVAFSEAVDIYKSVTNYEELYRWVSRELKNVLMSRAEFELQVKGIVSDDNSLFTLSAWEQVSPNMEMIVDYVNKEFNLNYDKSSAKKIKKDLSIIQYE